MFGLYYQAAMGQNFDVVFVRTKWSSPLSYSVVLKNTDKIVIHCKSVQYDPGSGEQGELLSSKKNEGLIEKWREEYNEIWSNSICLTEQTPWVMNER